MHSINSAPRPTNQASKPAFIGPATQCKSCSTSAVLDFFNNAREFDRSSGDRIRQVEILANGDGLLGFGRNALEAVRKISLGEYRSTHDISAVCDVVVCS